MATSQAAPATTAVVVSGGGTASTTSQTIFGSHIFTIESFTATKDLGIGKSIKSSIFRVGGHSWYIECYPCGDVEASAGWVTLYLRREDEDDHPVDIVSAKCDFTLMKPSRDGCLQKQIGHGTKSITLANDDRLLLPGTDLIKRNQLVNDCFQVRCDLRIEKIPAATQPDLGTETMAGSHVLTIDEYAQTKRALVMGESIESGMFRVGGHRWYFVFHPCGDDYYRPEDWVSVKLFLDNPGSDDEVKVQFEIALLTHGGQIISSTQDFTNFSESSNKEYSCSFLATMEHGTWPVLQDGIQIRCDIAVVNRFTAMPNLRRGIGGDLQGSHQHIRVSGDVTFEVNGHLFEAHKCVLATRCTAFMADFFAPAGKGNAGATDRVRVNDMEPRVFEALLHFIYTDALPEVRDEDMLVMAQGLLVAADRYAMERLKLICSDIMGTYVNDARTAIATLELADKHGCSRLKEVCMKFLKGHFVNGAP